MKKFIYIALGTLFLLVGSIIVLSLGEPKVEVEKQSVIESAFENKDTFVLVIGASTCTYCRSYKAGTLVQYLKDDPEIPLYFAYSDQSFANPTDFKNFIIKYGLAYEASPTTYVVKKGVPVARLEGDISLAELKQLIGTNL